MPPAEGGVPVDTTDLGGSADGKAVLEAPGEVVPLVLLAEPSQRSAGQSVESLGAVLASEPLQAVDHTPFADPDAATVRTLRAITKPILDCLDGLLCLVLGSSQRVQQGGALLRGQRGRVAQESLEVTGFHARSDGRIAGKAHPDSSILLDLTATVTFITVLVGIPLGFCCPEELATATGVPSLLGYVTKARFGGESIL